MPEQGTRNSNTSQSSTLRGRRLWLIIAIYAVLIPLLAAGAWFYWSNRTANEDTPVERTFVEIDLEEALRAPYGVQDRPVPDGAGFVVLASQVESFAQSSTDGEATQVLTRCNVGLGDTLAKRMLCDIDAFDRSPYLHLATYEYAQGNVGLLAVQLGDNLTLEDVTALPEGERSSVEGAQFEEGEDGDQILIELNSPLESDTIMRRIRQYIRENGTATNFALSEQAVVKHISGRAGEQVIFTWLKDDWLFIVTGPSAATLDQFMQAFPY